MLSSKNGIVPALFDACNAFLISKNDHYARQLAPETHPGRLAFVGDAATTYYVKQRLNVLHPKMTCSQLTTLSSKALSRRNMAKVFLELNLHNYCPWAISEAQRGEAFEQFIGSIIFTYERGSSIFNELEDLNDFLFTVSDLIINISEESDDLPGISTSSLEIVER